MEALNPEWFFPILWGLFLGLSAMALHEAAHLVTALAVGVKVKRIGFRWKGFYIVREAGSPGKNALISLAGPMANLILLLSWHWSPLFGLANLCFTFFNVLPLQGSDGERAWICWREMHAELSSQANRKPATLRKVGRGVVVPYPESATYHMSRGDWQAIGEFQEDEYKAS
jgi:hypothetical protein